MTHMTTRHRILDTPTGPFVVMEEASGAIRTGWVDYELQELLTDSQEDPTLLPEVVEKLEAYFEGEEVDFSGIPTPTGSEFFQGCWEACRGIPRGETRSYQELAEMAGGKPGSARAAGQAMRRNRLPVIIPCHRVIGADGGLHGFAGTDIRGSEALGRKEKLLALEGEMVHCA